MSNKTRYYVIADVHGMYSDLMKCIKLVRDNGGLDFKRGDVLVQLGDRNDRGPDTYRVNNFFYKLQKRYPSQVVCLRGNHEDMMLNFKEPDMFEYNGGHLTMRSYGSATKMYGKKQFKASLRKTNHLDWHLQQFHYWETDDYFFCHAPIPKKGYRGSIIADLDPRQDVHCLTWSYEGHNLAQWVDEEPFEGKMSFHGHIHGVHYEDGNVVIPGIRQIGNSFVLDTGAGCHPEGYLTCLELPSFTAYTSRGEVLAGTPEVDKEEETE